MSSQSGKRTTLVALLVGLILVGLFPATGVAQKGKSKARAKKTYTLPPVDISKLVWPQPPQPTRIRFTTMVLGERDLASVKAKKQSWLEKAAGVSVQDSELPRLRKPYGVAVDSKGRIYVGDSALGKVFVFDLEKKQLSFRGDRQPAQFKVIIGVAIDDKDRLFVSDADMQRVTVFDANGEFQAVFGSDKLKVPAGMAVDNELRRLYVADAKGARIAIFDLDSYKFIRYIESKGPTPEEPTGHLGSPSNIAVDADGLIYVVDTLVNRVEVFDSDGNYVRGFGEQGNTIGKFARPKGIAIDSDGHVYVADSAFNKVQIFTPEGQPLLAFGTFGPQEGQFLLLTGLAFDKFDRLVATDGGPVPRIEVFRYVNDSEAAAAEAKKETASTNGQGKGDAK